MDTDQEPTWTTVVGKKGKQKQREREAGQRAPAPSGRGRVLSHSRIQRSGVGGPTAPNGGREVLPRPTAQKPVPGVLTPSAPKRSQPPGKPLAPQKAAPKPKPVGKPKLPRAPTSAAVAITTPAVDGAKFMAEARKRITLTDVGIEGHLKVRKSLAGALILEVGGAEANLKADRLAAKLQELATERGDSTKIRRPIKMAALRIRDVEDSLSKEEIATAIATMGGCTSTEVTVGEFSSAPRGAFTIVARCPLAAAIKVAAEERIPLGWVRSRVELLAARPLICFKCMRRGHVRGQCRSSEDLSSCCLRCGVPGHRAKDCKGQPSCPLCKKAGRPSGHMAGGTACLPPSKNRGGNKGKEGAKGEKEAPPNSALNEGMGVPNAPTPMETEGPEASTA